MRQIFERRDEDGVAILTWNDPTQPVNVKSKAAIHELSGLVAEILADETIGGYVIASGKASFVAGGDLDELRRCASAADVSSLLAPVRALLRQIETGGKVAVAAIAGPALGGGLELALACHRRVAAGASKTVFGLPEVSLGLMPGAGGTQRLPRLIGLDRALTMATEGKPIDVEEALGCGLINQLVGSDELLAAAISLARSGIRPVQPWDEPEHAITFHPQSTTGRRIFASAWPKLKARSGEFDISVDAILMAMHHGLQRDLETGLLIEARHFGRVASGQAARNIIRTSFYGYNSARQIPARPKDVPAGEINRIAVVGAGLMGSGIAAAAAAAGLGVTLVDRDFEAARAGIAKIEQDTEKAVASGRMSATGRKQLLERIVPAVSGCDLAHADAVIEAVFEVESVKAEALRQISRKTCPGTLIASNTSTLPISVLARYCERPTEFIGLHFFAPVERMELVETIRGDDTSPKALALGLDLVKRLRKLPIVVGDGPGFYTSRVISAYTGEALTLLAEGVDPVVVDSIALRFGMPIGPLAMADLTGIPVLCNIFDSLRPGRQGSVGLRADEALQSLMAAGRIGKAQGGIFNRDVGTTRWIGLPALFASAATRLPPEDIRRRLVHGQVLEAVRALEEGILASPIDGDIGSVLGWRFPLAYGGVFSFVDTLGADRFVAECQTLSKNYGARFTPPDILREMAESGREFHSMQ